jgi:hypothetical protein
MNKILIAKNGLFALNAEDREKALDMGCKEEYVRLIAEGSVMVGHSTIGWIGVYVNFKRIKRFQKLERAINFANKIAA